MLRTALNASGALFLLTSIALAHEYTHGTLVIDHPYARETAAGAPVAGGYMTIRNNGDKPDRLVGGTAGFAGMIQIHEMTMDGDVMRVREIAGGLEIPAGSEIVLKPGGYHVMFMQLKEPLSAGEKRPVQLEFRDAGKIDVQFNVETMKPGEGGHHQHGANSVSESSQAAQDGHGMAHGNAMSHAGSGDAEQIVAILKQEFDRPEAPLIVDPVVISGDWAVAGWAQDGRGGRGLMKKDDKGWFVLMCSGASFKDGEKLAASGVPMHDAMTIARGLKEREGKLGAAVVALFDSFEGTVEVGRSGHQGHGAAHQGHSGHKN